MTRSSRAADQKCPVMFLLSPALVAPCPHPPAGSSQKLIENEESKNSKREIALVSGGGLSTGSAAAKRGNGGEKQMAKDTVPAHILRLTGSLSSESGLPPLDGPRSRLGRLWGEEGKTGETGDVTGVLAGRSTHAISL